MVSQSPKDTPFGLEPNIAAGLAYLLTIVGGVLMLVGGGTNRFVKFAAAQSITLWLSWIVVWFALDVVVSILHFLILLWIPVSMLLSLLGFVVWLWTSISGFQGKEVRVPFVADITQSIFKAQLAQ
jgi:uncharacterized membrane protein